MGLDGATAEGNRLDGLLIQDVPNVTVGVPSETFSQVNPALYRNVISANLQNGVDVEFPLYSVLGNENIDINGNYLGTDRGGGNTLAALFGSENVQALGNQYDGLLVVNACRGSRLRTTPYPGNRDSLASILISVLQTRF